ncbi:MAG: response regulator [Lachnospiraceae bacterium]|nr:response regulator [Lachnospiraceae bacterium]
MQMKYNIYIELTTIVFAAILCIYQEVQYADTDKTDVNTSFRRMAWIVFLAVTMDVLTAVTISYSDFVPKWLNYLLNTIYFELDALIAFFFVQYVASYIYTRDERHKLTWANIIASAIYTAILLINLINGWVFYFDDMGVYTHGTIYIVTYLMPLYYFVFSSTILIKHWDRFKKKQQLSIIAFLICVALGPVLQFLFCPDVLLGIFTITIGLIILHYSLETPDYVLLLKTMDELNIAKEEALEANRVKGEFLANMSHELRTPMNVMLGFNEVLMNETQESHTAEYAMKIQSAGRALISMVNDVIDFTSIDRGDLNLDIKPYDTTSLLQDVVSYAEYFSQIKALECRISIDEKIPQQLSGDVIRLTQIINNLLSNAIKFTKEGYIEFKAAWEKVDDTHGRLCIDVSDTGIGMRKEDVEKLEMLGAAERGFQRFDNRNTRNVQGIGLGLTIVNRLLALMDSNLKITSEYGKGTEFHFGVLQDIVKEVPIGSLDSISKNRETAAESLKLIAPDARVLVADDNAMNLDMFKGLLKQTGMHIDTAVNGEEALKLLEKNKYHLIFLDHMMPVMDGMETLREMKKRNLCPDIPVIILTANAVAGARESYLAEGFEDYLSKPVQRNQLVKTLRKYLPEDLCVENADADKQNVADVEINTENIIESNQQDAAAGQGLLSKLTFLNTEVGMTYCCDSEEFYQEMLASYLDNKRDAELEDYYKQEDWENYRIAVHALKSTSLSIGAVDVSEKAKAMEMAAKENDTSYLTANHEDLMKNYSELLSHIDGAINGEKEVPQQIKSGPDGNMPSIFAVDDDLMNLRIIERMLEGQFSVTSFDAGNKLLEALKNELPDIILLDVRMPEMDGFEVLRRLKSNERYKEVPVIFLTADEERDTEVEGFKAGVLDFIRKPFVLEIMIQRVKRIIQMDRLQKNLQSEVDKQTSEIVEQRNQVERINEEIILTLAGAIDAKDKYTNGHSNRVAEYARAIAERLGKPAAEINNIYVAGLLHDVGKIGISDNIINKPGKLTDEEYATIKTHPTIGANILSNISAIQDIATGAHWHHERYDGKGYPDGLAGEAIPEMARIIGVADTYDAMTSKRSYRDVLPQNVVREELVKGRGTQFDPIFTDVMLSMMDEDTQYHMREH